MKGIYLTQEGKQEIEAEIQLLLKRHKEESESCKPIEAVLYTIKSKISIYRDILSSAIVLPVSNGWEHGSVFTNNKYKNGVIIQPID